MNGTRLSTLDRWGMIVSGACLLHCLALPIIALLLPIAGTMLPDHEWVHPILLGVALPVTGGALLRGYRIHRLRRPVLWGAAGLALIAGALPMEGTPGETILTVAGGLLILRAHLVNWRAHGQR